MKWLVSFCLRLDFGCIIMRNDGSFKNEFPDVQVDFKKYEKFKKSILILMLIFLVWLKNCNLLFFNNSFNLLYCAYVLFSLYHNKIQCSPTVFVHNILIIWLSCNIIITLWGIIDQVEPPLATQFYWTSKTDLYQIRSEIDNGLRRTQFGLNWLKKF